MEKLLEIIQEFWAQLQIGAVPQIAPWNYVILAILVAVEGPIATLLGAAAASAGFMQLYLVFIFAAMGNLTADLLWYSLGYSGRIEWLYWFGRWFKIRPAHVDRLKAGMQLHASKILLVAKLTAAFTIPSLIAAGLARVPLRRWLPVLLISETIWTGSLVVIGYYAIETIKKVEEGMTYITLFGSILFFIMIFVFARRALTHDETFSEVIEKDKQKEN